MTRIFSLTTCLAMVTLLSLAVSANAATPTLAVAYFDDNTGKAEYAPLRKGLADMIITDLTGVSGLQIVEREKLNQVLGELKLAQGRFIDPRTAQKLGHGLAAAYILTGSYTMVGDTLRLDCRIIEVATGKVAASQQVAGKQDDFFALEKDLVQLLLDTAAVKLAAPDRTRLRRNQTQSFAAFDRYAAGLDAHDRGDDERARVLFQAALDADPAYAAARTASDRLKAILERADRQNKVAQDRQLTELDPKAADFGQKVNDLLASYDVAQVEQLRRKVALLRWLAEKDLTPSAGGLSRTAVEILSLVSSYLEAPAQAAVIPAVCEYVVTRFPKERMPPAQCKVYLSTLDTLAKTRAAHPGAMTYPTWKERRQNATLDWQIALLENERDILQLFALYASKVRH